ncbi:MAG: hypothetical protein MUC88_20470 [Planctomycetes bacterium]|jgi:hypothetical protein|nr:hypothetical protein [Planctomycetota bacterium]
MKRASLILVGMVAALALFTVPSCTDEQLQRADRVFADANAIGRGVAAIPDGPAGVLIPPDVRCILELLGVTGAAALVLWQKIRSSKILERKQDLAVTLKAIVDGIEQSGIRGRDAVKPAIAEVMKDRDIYGRANAIVDQYKAAANRDLT